MAALESTPRLKLAMDFEPSGSSDVPDNLSVRDAARHSDPRLKYAPRPSLSPVEFAKARVEIGYQNINGRGGNGGWVFGP